jgi:hypothetical protein
VKTYTKEDFHNPENLTRQQVGEEHRLLLPEEVDGRFGEDNQNNGQCLASSKTDAIWVGEIEGNMRDFTYRVPLATPLPDGTVLTSNECCWADDAAQAEPQKFKYAPDDPKGHAGSLKAPMHLLPPDALLETAKVMGFGAANYGPWNFIGATVCSHTYIAAIGRHWAAYAKGEDVDPDSGLSHLAHLAANCFILMTAAQQGTLNDDRPKLKPSAEK